MRRPGNLNGLKMKPKALGSFGQYGYSLPAGAYNLKASVQYYPAIQELVSMPGLPYDATAHENKSRELCGQIKASIEKLINKAATIGDNATKQEMQNIYKEAQDVEAAVRNERPPYPEAPLLPMWRKAEKLVGDLESKIKAPPPPPPPPPPPVVQPPPVVAPQPTITTQQTTTSPVKSEPVPEIIAPKATTVESTVEAVTQSISKLDGKSKTILTVLGTTIAVLIISRLMN